MKDPPNSGEELGGEVDSGAAATGRSPVRPSSLRLAVVEAQPAGSSEAAESSQLIDLDALDVVDIKAINIR